MNWRTGDNICFCFIVTFYYTLKFHPQQMKANAHTHTARGKLPECFCLLCTLIFCSLSSYDHLECQLLLTEQGCLCQFAASLSTFISRLMLSNFKTVCVISKKLFPLLTVLCHIFFVGVVFSFLFVSGCFLYFPFISCILFISVLSGAILAPIWQCLRWRRFIAIGHVKLLSRLDVLPLLFFSS